MLYADWMLDPGAPPDTVPVAPPWLKGPTGRAWLRGIGQSLDANVERARQAVKASFPGTAASRTNLCPYSQQFDSWTTSHASVVANVLAAPDGTVTADALVEDTTSNAHELNVGLGSLSIGQTYTASCYVAGMNRSAVTLAVTWGSDFAQVYWDLTSGAVIGQGATANATIVATPAAVVAVPGTWWRISFTFTVTGGSGSAKHLVRSTIGTNQVYLGAGVTALYPWGAQVEPGSIATDYIATGASAVSVYTPGPNSAPNDALPLIGSELGMPQGLVETQAAYRARLAQAWTIWQYAGTAYGLLMATYYAGYPRVVLQTQLGRQYQLAATLTGNPAQDLVISQMATPVHLGGSPEGWTDFAAVILQPFPSWWSGVPADGSSDQQAFAALLKQWKSAHARCVQIKAITGPAWGVSMTWGSFTWGGGTATTWTPQN